MQAILKIFQWRANKKHSAPAGKAAQRALKPISITLHNTSDSRLYALVIGVNSYPKLKPLTGAVADAAAMEDFLVNDLKVPPDHIINLRNDQATRGGIIQAFRRLRDSSRIHKGDPILIYYAGHGGNGTAPAEWKTKYGHDEIQVIFPYDYDLPVPGSKETVNCIPDRTIGMLLNELAVAKGNNITVVLDSCHSASGNRGNNIDDTASGRIAREADVSVQIPGDIDSDMFPTAAVYSGLLGQTEGESRHPELPLYTDQASHIHLAACGSEEKAWEEEGRGVFTAALLKCIRGNGVDKISYENLMLSLPMLPKQSPHCYGIHKSRILFDSRVPSYKVMFVPVKLERDTWVLQAGAASGVTLGSIWELRAKPTEDSKPLGQLQARTPQVSLTVLAPESDYKGVPPSHILGSAGLNRLYARQIRAGTGNELRVYFSPEAKRLVFDNNHALSAAGANDYEVGYVVHPARDSADLIVEVYCPKFGPGLQGTSAETEVEYTLCDPQVLKYGVAKLKQRTRANLDEVEHVLFAAARWNWHLKRASPSPRSKSTVSMEFVKLGTMFGDEMVPVDGPLENLNKTGIVDLVVREEDQYGIRLTSQAGVALYVRVFYFDADLSIDDMFGHSQANGRQDPELPMRGSFLVGDSYDGGPPFPFGLGEGEDIDVGFIKVFWSTDPLKLSNLTQESPFGVQAGVGARKVLTQQAKPVKEWGTLLMTLVQRG